MSYKKQEHNTRIIKDSDLELYSELEAEDAKRLICAYLSFKSGQTVNDYFPDKKDSLRYVFMQMISYLEANDRKYQEKLEKLSDNGKKGGEVKANRGKTSIKNETSVDDFLHILGVNTNDRSELGC